MNVLNRLFAKALTLEIGEQEVSFQALAEFEFALAGRTDVPAKKLAELIELSAQELKQEAKAIKAVEQQFVGIMSKAIESPSSIGMQLREIDLLVFSQDHGWRDIVRALNDKDAEYDEFRRIALVKYMQYLRSRQDVIKQAYKLKKQAAKATEEAAGQTMVFEAPADPPPGSAGLRDTVIFDSVIIDQQAAEGEFTRLLKGEATNIRLHAGNAIELRLSKHRFTLASGEHYEVIDDKGRTQALMPGKNIVGRDSVCNIVIDNSYRDVSRIHLLIEPLEDYELRFTDLSSHGTFLPSRALG